MLASALAATALNATAQDGDVAAGHAFAREACKSCHVVEPTNASPRIVVVGPSFQDIANTKGDDGHGSADFPDHFAPEDAEPDPHTGRNIGCDRVYPQLTG